MRPPKRILLIDPNEDRRGELAFVLSTHRYQIKAHLRGPLDAILAHWPIASGSCKRLKKNYPDAKLIIIVPPGDRFPISIHADVMVWESMNRVNLLTELRIACTAKRGPKKGVKRAVPQVVVEAVA